MASDPSFDAESLPQWPALTTMILGNAVQATTLGVFIGFAELPIVRTEESAPPSDRKLTRLLAEAVLDNAALKDHRPISPQRLAISGEATVKRIVGYA
ncbi:hypothetical protein [Rhizobium ruizarguesonis]|uniref:hypothetical protein n=1 Tax=Rhizobium ruizarguesonis TaxID=2081791 RepID=UPI001FDA2415|nr:hypothetical protein [Rhizobium ruizarguesonis]